jgi:hypothetical protein
MIAYCGPARCARVARSRSVQGVPAGHPCDVCVAPPAASFGDRFPYIVPTMRGKRSPKSARWGAPSLGDHYSNTLRTNDLPLAGTIGLYVTPPPWGGRVPQRRYLRCKTMTMSCQKWYRLLSGLLGLSRQHLGRGHMPEAWVDTALCDVRRFLRTSASSATCVAFPGQALRANRPHLHLRVHTSSRASTVAARTGLMRTASERQAPRRRRSRPDEWASRASSGAVLGVDRIGLSLMPRLGVR